MNIDFSKDIIEATRYFIKVVELGSYSSVKKFYNVELNTIKSKIDILENYLGVKLIQNIHNRITPTKNGVKYFHSCSKIYKDLESTIDSVKNNGFKERRAIRILGSPLSIKVTIDRVIPKLNQDSTSNLRFTLDNYALNHLDGKEYQFETYDVILINTKHLEHIDLNDWIICKSVNTAKLPALIYGDKNFIKDLHNEPQKVLETDLVFNRYDWDHNIFNFIHKEDAEDNHQNKTYRFNPNKIKYLVSNEVQKSNIIKKENVIGFMPKFYYDSLMKDSEYIDFIRGFEVDFHIESFLVLVYKYSKHKDKLVEAFRTELLELLGNDLDDPNDSNS
ncbi:DNA-binding transcriptional LysR family regulator [Allofrancisella inopinata]|uniref:LysR family transcriptional regulator n=1 Tax=Allofrancisella inopinata TaxID=1085647 RepID=A0AAE7CSG7_9GAMM|nr:LysR family transcriptional regulator [Allofrancisella inopinata]QIV96753.1 LysR family transcriptional regulator [Allofrancisella inopinata]TDT73512.1 DNA-binding transcriptional LysR family regulator [Allofrancisella inopinata]